MTETHCVTGAFGYTGSYIARGLLSAGHRVRTLTNSPHRGHGFGNAVDVFPLDFSDATGLRRALRGTRVLYNTYWVRFSKAGFSQARAVENTVRLFGAAIDAGVQRIVHISVTNPHRDSPYEYFRCKAQLEEALVSSGVSHAILRPAVVFGGPDILVNNIAWLLRNLPVFGVFGDGDYRMQPIHVEDFAALAVERGQGVTNEVLDAVGPETWRYRDLIDAIGEAIGRRRPIVRVPRWLGIAAGTILGWALHDVVLTREEVEALMDDLLVTDSPPVGHTRLSQWIRQSADTIGRHYASELARRRDRVSRYEAL